jgi:hypothetical protein
MHVGSQMLTFIKILCEFVFYIKTGCFGYYENGRVRAQLFWLKILLLEGRHVSAPQLGHHQVTKNIFRGNYVGGRVTVRVILQRDFVVKFVAKISRVIAKHLPIKVLNLMSIKIYKLQLTSIIHIYVKITLCVMNVQSLTKLFWYFKVVFVYKNDMYTELNVCVWSALL